MDNLNNINNIFNISNIDNKNLTEYDFSNINELNIFNYNRVRKMKRRLYENKYETLLEYLLNKNIPKKNTRIKINQDNYFVPDINNYNLLLEYDFKLNELKSILKEYSLKTTGNKDILLTRIYNYLYLCNRITKIQSNMRRYYVKKYTELQGPALYNRSLCINCKDFCTMISIKDIPKYQFISIKVDEEHIYGFDIMSIYNLFIKGNTPENPFTKIEFSQDVLTRVLKFIKYSKILNIDINVNFNDLVVNNENDRINLRIVSIFQKINMLGNYANSCWFTSLSRENLILFIRELVDIWNYRANLNDNTKRDICPPNGNPFKNIVNSSISQLEYIKIKKLATNIIDNIISNGIDDENKKLGAFYVLSGLTLVNIDAANAMPWLYQSVMHS